MELSSRGGETLNLTTATPAVPVMPYGGGYGNNGGMFGGDGLGALLIGALLFGGRGIGGFGGGAGYGGGYGSPAAAAVATDSVLDSQFDCISNQIGSLASNIGHGALTSSINTGFANTNNLINGHVAALGNIQTQIADANFQTLQSLNGNLAAITAQNNQGALQQLNSFNILNSSIQQGFNTSNIATLTGFNNTNAAISTATNQIIAQGTALSAQLASCCCDLQNAIERDGDETRALINSINLQNIQGQLADAKSQISNFQQTQTLLDSLTKREVRCDRDRDRDRII